MVNGPGEAEVSHFGLAGSNKKSAFYEDGKRQKERFDNDDLNLISWKQKFVQKLLL